MVVSEIVNKDGKAYIEYKGRPYLMYGVQIRTDEAEEIAENESVLEQNFSKAAELGFRSVMLPLRWRSFETENGIYNFKRLDSYIEWADKYDLDIHLLWFGSNVCGKQKSLPAFILGDTEKYKCIDGEYIDLSNNALLIKEKAALGQILNRLYKNDLNRRTAVIQIENEPDYGSKWQNQYNDCLRYINELGMLVKKSRYSVVTRVNITANAELKTNNVPEDILALDGIDAVGVDIYINETEFYNGWIEKLSTGEMLRNPVYIAEGGGQMELLLRIIANAFSLGCGYLVYELRTVRKNDYDFGVYRLSTDKWEYRDGTKLVQHQWTQGELIPENNTKQLILFNNAVNAVARQIAVARPEDIYLTDNMCEIPTDCGKIRYETQKNDPNSFGLLIKTGNGEYCFFTVAENSKLCFENKVTVFNGRYLEDKWVTTENIPLNSGAFSPRPGEVYKICGLRR